MLKFKYISCIYHTILFFCSKRSQIEFCKLLNNKDSQEKRVTRKCTSEPYSFLVIDTTLPPDNLLKFRKNILNPL